MASLVGAVRRALRICYPAKLTCAQVRDQLRLGGFDFSAYESNPLPSVSTTLRRLKEAGEVALDESVTVATYQAKRPKNVGFEKRDPSGSARTWKLSHVTTKNKFLSSAEHGNSGRCQSGLAESTLLPGVVLLKPLKSRDLLCCLPSRVESSIAFPELQSQRLSRP